MKEKNPESSPNKELFSAGGSRESLLDAVTTIFDALANAPIASSLQKSMRVFDEVRQNQLRQKIARFLEELHKYTPEQIDKFKYDKMQDPENFMLVSEITLDILEKADTSFIARMIGSAYSRYLSGELHQVTFEAHASVIRSLNLHLIRQLKQIYGAESASVFDAPTGFLLATLGLMTPYTPLKVTDRVTTTHEKNEYGKSFYDHYLMKLDLPSLKP